MISQVSKKIYRGLENTAFSTYRTMMSQPLVQMPAIPPLEISGYLPDTPTLFVFLVLFCILRTAYIKIRYPFWNIQPVFHTYDYWRYLYQTAFIINPSQSLHNSKFCDVSQVKTYSYVDTTLEQRTKWVDFLRCYYIPSDRIVFTITEPILYDYMTGSEDPAYVSFFQETQYIQNPPTENGDRLGSFKKSDPIGCISSRPIDIYIGLSNPRIPGYFWDFISSKREHKTKHLSRKLIQTHEYNQRLHTPERKVSLFKKEIHLCEGIVAVTTYPIYTFFIKNEPVQDLPMGTYINIFSKTDMNDWTTFIEYSKKNDVFRFHGIADTGILVNMIQNKQLYMCCLKVTTNIFAYYFFKNANIQYESETDVEMDCNTLIFSASMRTQECSDSLFFLGFMQAMKTIFKQNRVYQKGSVKKSLVKQRRPYTILLFESISHNVEILEKWEARNTVLSKHDAAYYLYNMVFPRSRALPKDIFILL